MSETRTMGIVEGYEKNWYFADFWPGEYPARFSIISDGVELIGRADMRLKATKNVKCAVPKFATYSPWNHERNENDDLLYRSVTQVTELSLSGDIRVPAIRQSDDADIILEMEKDGSLHFLVYHGEGFALYQYNGENYVMSEGDFQNQVEFSNDDGVTIDLWLRLPSVDGGTGWVLYDEVVKTESIIISEIEGYGVASDLPDPASFSLDGVVFHSGSAELTEDSKTLLDRLAQKLRNVRNVSYEIAGYTDSSGASDSNLALSQKRAEAVHTYLVDVHGLSASLLTPMGYGEANPIADNATPEGRTKNRRVELNLLG